ncbi:MAG: bifunctional sulfate adenylyltransferase/adenylylsulfate kinase [Acidobacteria bacterium]|nr:bifunctional sulfate adenylyltransferase/adenylylsulfate kinase [Acidobacteriota bacterium]
MEAYGGTLVQLLADGKRAKEILSASRDWPSWALTPRQICDLELLMNGALSPLTGFMGRDDVASVCESGRLASGLLWPIPVTLDVPSDLAKALIPGRPLCLRDPEGLLLAILHVQELWRADRELEAGAVCGTTSLAHPGARHLLRHSHPCYVGGLVEGIRLPVHDDFVPLRHTPESLRREIRSRSWRRVVAFQTRNPMHRAHFEITRRAALEVDGGLVIHPAVGMTRPGDIDHFTRTRCYERLLPRYPEGSALLSLLPLAMRMAGPREALFHAIIRRNYGCTHLIVGRDHAGPGVDEAGRPFYGPYDAQRLVEKHEAELGVGMVAFDEMVYVKETNAFVADGAVPIGATALRLSGTDLRRRLAAGDEIPEWFTYPEVARELRHRHPPLDRQGFTVFFTGLSASGKSTIARALVARLMESGSRRITLLDGDLVRRHLSSELGFSREHRDLNVLRIGYVASEVTRHGGIAVCAPIAPYDAARVEVRSMIEAEGGFFLVHVATSIETCERRDPKGLYAKARAGTLPAFTGVSDPYEPPGEADLVLDTDRLTPAGCVGRICALLELRGYAATRTVRTEPAVKTESLAVR